MDNDMHHCHDAHPKTLLRVLSQKSISFLQIFISKKLIFFFSLSLEKHADHRPTNSKNHYKILNLYHRTNF